MCALWAAHVTGAVRGRVAGASTNKGANAQNCNYNDPTGHDFLRLGECMLSALVRRICLILGPRRVASWSNTQKARYQITSRDVHDLLVDVRDDASAPEAGTALPFGP